MLLSHQQALSVPKACFMYCILSLYPSHPTTASSSFQYIRCLNLGLCPYGISVPRWASDQQLPLRFMCEHDSGTSSTEDSTSKCMTSLNHAISTLIILRLSESDACAYILVSASNGFEMTGLLNSKTPRCSGATVVSFDLKLHV